MNIYSLNPISKTLAVALLCSFLLICDYDCNIKVQS